MSDFPKTQTGKIRKHLLKKEGVTNDTWKKYQLIVSFIITLRKK